MSKPAYDFVDPAPAPTKYLVSDIIWDEEENEDTILPNEVAVEVVVYPDEDVIDIIAEKLSDDYGFCVESFSYEKVEPKVKVRKMKTKKQKDNRKVFAVPVIKTEQTEVTVRAKNKKEAVRFVEGLIESSDDPCSWDFEDFVELKAVGRGAHAVKESPYVGVNYNIREKDGELVSDEAESDRG